MIDNSTHTTGESFPDVTIESLKELTDMIKYEGFIQLLLRAKKPVIMCHPDMMKLAKDIRRLLLPWRIRWKTKVKPDIYMAEGMLYALDADFFEKAASDQWKPKTILFVSDDQR